MPHTVLLLEIGKRLYSVRTSWREDLCSSNSVEITIDNFILFLNNIYSYKLHSFGVSDYILKEYNIVLHN